LQEAVNSLQKREWKKPGNLNVEGPTVMFQTDGKGIVARGPETEKSSTELGAGDEPPARWASWSRERHNEGEKKELHRKKKT